MSGFYNFIRCFRSRSGDTKRGISDNVKNRVRAKPSSLKGRMSDEAFVLPRHRVQLQHEQGSIWLNGSGQRWLILMLVEI